MRPAPVLLYLIHPAAQPHPAAQAKTAHVHAARRPRWDNVVLASGRRLLQRAGHLLPA